MAREKGKWASGKDRALDVGGDVGALAPVGLVVYPGEGHGFTSRPENRRDALRRQLAWFLAFMPPPRGLPCVPSEDGAKDQTRAHELAGYQ